MRTDPPETGPELDQLTAFLDLQRETMLRKTEGLTREQLAQPHPPSTLTLGGLLNHLALVEDSWFRVRFAGLPDDDLWAGIDWDADPDYEFRTAADARARGAAPPVRAGLRAQPGGRGRGGEPGPAVGARSGATGSTSTCAGCCCT